jgi:hypothetical protein
MPSHQSRLAIGIIGSFSCFGSHHGTVIDFEVVAVGAGVTPPTMIASGGLASVIFW